MSPPDVLDPFRTDHLQRRIHTYNKRDGGRPGRVVLFVRLQRLPEIKVELRKCGCLHRFYCPWAHRHESEPGRNHKTFLRSRDAGVDAPLVEPKFVSADCGNPVHAHKRFRVLANHARKRLDVGCRTGRRLAVRQIHRFRVGVGLQRGQYLVRCRSFAPFDFHLNDIESKRLRHLDPSLAKLPAVDRDQRVARGKERDECRFNATGAGACER